MGQMYGPRMCNFYRLGDADRHEPLCKQTGILAYKNINYNDIISTKFYSAKVIKINLTHEHRSQF